MKNLLIWVLKDDRPGNYNQAINLAEALEIPYEIQEISYNKLASLPNFLKFGSFSTLEKSSKNNLLTQKNKPDIIISAGRRSAAIALDLKKNYPHLFLINIMNPVYNISKFDLIIAPKHDGLKGDNVLEIIGSIAQIKEKSIAENYQKFAPAFEKIKSPKIALLLGGSSKNAQFKLEDAQNIREITDNLCKNMKANLIVTSSRRTDQFIIDEINRDNKNIKYFFEWKKDAPNPYLAILKDADFIIATGDSISMCCEICYLGKPVYIYFSENICSKKHLKFLQELFVGNFAFPLTKDLQKLPKKKLNKLNEVAKIAAVIRKQLKT